MDTKKFLAELETPNFVFHALGDTEKMARQLILQGWKKHCRQTGAELDYVTPTDINVTEMVVNGPALRDWQKI